MDRRRSLDDRQSVQGLARLRAELDAADAALARANAALDASDLTGPEARALLERYSAIARKAQFGQAALAS